MAQTSITEVPCGVMCEWRAVVMAQGFSCFKDLKANEWERVAKGSTDTKLASRWCLKAGSGRLASFGMNSSNLQAPGQSLLQTVSCSTGCPGGHLASLNKRISSVIPARCVFHLCLSIITVRVSKLEEIHSNSFCQLQVILPQSFTSKHLPAFAQPLCCRDGSEDFVGLQVECFLKGDS